MTCIKFSTIVAAVILVLTISVAVADVPRMINYQGSLTDSEGNPLSGEYNMIFTIYDDPVLSEPVNVRWQETHDLVSVNDGLFNVILGAGTPPVPLDNGVFSDDARYLGIQVGADAEISPRTRIVSTGYAHRVATVDGAAGGVLSGNVGIDVASPSGKLDVAGQSIFRREDGVQDRITIGVGDPNVALELRSGTTEGTPYIDFANDDVTDFDARIRLREDGLLAIEGTGDASLQVDGRLRVDKSLSADSEPSEELDALRSYYTYYGSAGSPYTYQGSALRARTIFGGNMTNPIGTGHGISSECVMLESGNSQNEMTPLYLGCVAHAPCRLWGVDLSVHGPVSSQADLIQGVVNFVNNYNAAPIPNGGIGMAVVTRPGTGGSATPEQQISQTYPVNVGLAIVGYSGTPDEAVKTQGFETALQIGGNASGWMQAPLTSRHGTGILIRDVETAGIRFQDFLSSDAPALSVGVPSVMDVHEGGVPKWKLSQEGSGTDATLLLRDLTEGDEWWWGTMAGGDKRLSFQKDRMVVMRDGKVGIGTPVPDNILTVVQSSATDPIADAWTVYSSRRWKENITPIPNALGKVKMLSGVYFDWKETGRRDIGMIAEEVGEILPEVVTYEENKIDAKSLDYARITALLVEAIKEQQKTIEQLQAQMQALLAR